LRKQPPLDCELAMTKRRQRPAQWFSLGALIFAALAISLACGAKGDERVQPPGGAPAVGPSATEAVATPTATASPVAQPSLPPVPTPAPQPQPPPPPDRSSCAEIRGTDYRSAAERQWYVDNCVAPAGRATGPTPQAGAPPLPAPEAQLIPNVSWIPYVVMGTTADEINAYVRSHTFPGLGAAWAITSTRFTVEFRGVEEGGACRTISLRVIATISVQYPVLAEPALLDPELLRRWQAFSEFLRVHEQQHVDISLGGASLLRTAVAAQPALPTCDLMRAEFERFRAHYLGFVDAQSRALDATIGHGGVFQ
jgi:predicted secreted Zn-dependent protease